MKKIYWRPRQVSRIVLVLISVCSVVGFIAVDRFQIRTKQRFYDEMIGAAQLAAEAMEVIKEERESRGSDIDTTSDPTESGLIGALMTPVTSDPGSLTAKQTTINPNFAAVIVQWLKAAEVKEGDVVAVGLSGSFPAINISVCAAIEALGLRPVIISSAAASQWGANDPELLWIDMERILDDKEVFPHMRSVAASLGGPEDRALGMPEDGQRLLAEAVARNKLRLIQPKTFTDAINQRMQIYKQAAGTSPIKAYVNVGGGTISVGTRVGKRIFSPGLNLRAPREAMAVDSIMTRFAKEGVPVIHLVQIEKLAVRYGLPVQPKTMPIVGEGKVFYREEHNRWLAAGVLVAILASLYAFIRSEWGFRLIQSSRRKKGGDYLEPMI